MRGFFNSRSTDANATPLQQSFADTLIMMLKKATDFGPAIGGELNKALADKPYGDEQTARIHAQIDALLTASLTRVAAPTSSKKGKKETKPGKATPEVLVELHDERGR